MIKQQNIISLFVKTSVPVTKLVILQILIWLLLQLSLLQFHYGIHKSVQNNDGDVLLERRPFFFAHFIKGFGQIDFYLGKLRSHLHRLRFGFYLIEVVNDLLQDIQTGFFNTERHLGLGLSINSKNRDSCVLI